MTARGVHSVHSNSVIAREVHSAHSNSVVSLKSSHSVAVGEVYEGLWVEGACGMSVRCPTGRGLPFLLAWLPRGLKVLLKALPGMVVGVV